MEKRLHNVKRILNFREDVTGCFCSQLGHKFPSYFASHHLYVIEVKQIINFNHVFMFSMLLFDTCSSVDSRHHSRTVLINFPNPVNCSHLVTSHLSILVGATVIVLFWMWK